MKKKDWEKKSDSDLGRDGGNTRGEGGAAQEGKARKGKERELWVPTPGTGSGNRAQGTFRNRKSGTARRWAAPTHHTRTHSHWAGHAGPTMDWLTVVQSAQRAAVVRQPELAAHTPAEAKWSTDMPLNGGKEQGRTLQPHRAWNSACVWVLSSSGFAVVLWVCKGGTQSSRPVHTIEPTASNLAASRTSPNDAIPTRFEQFYLSIG